jgi:hypothetical protein
MIYGGKKIGKTRTVLNDEGQLVEVESQAGSNVS